MGLLCTLRFAIRHLVACPTIPLFLYPSRCTVSFFSVPCLQRFPHSVAHSIKDGRNEGSGPVSEGAHRQGLPRSVSGALSPGAVVSGTGVHSPKVSSFGQDRQVVDTGRWSKDSRENRLDLPGEDGERAYSMQLMNRRNVEDEEKETFSTGHKLFGATKEKLELRAQVVQSLLLNILNLQDVTLVGHVLNEWLRKFASKSDIFFTLDNLSRHGDRNNMYATGRFVPYAQVARIVHAVMQDLGNRGHFEAALEILRWMERQGWCQLDPHMYTTILVTLGEAGGFELAEKIFESLDRTKVKKDTALLNAMLNVRGKAGQIDLLEDLFESMKRSSCKPDLISYNTVMNSYVRAGMGLGSVVDIFRYMYAQGVDPDLVSFDILLQACISGQHVKEAQKVFDNLKKRGLKPSVVTYTTMITLYASSGHCAEAVQLLSDMLAENCHPNNLTFSSLITACGRSGNIEEAEKLFQAMKEIGVEANVVTYNSMIDMYGKGGDFKLAQQKYKELEQAGLKPTSVTVTSLMCSLKGAGAYDEVLSFYDQAKQESLCNEHVFTEAIDTCIKWGKLQKIKDIQSDMVAVNCIPNVVTCSIVLAALGSKCSSAEDAGVLANFLQGFASDLALNSCKILLEQMSNDGEVLHNINRVFHLLDKEEMRTWTLFSSALVDALWALGWYRRATHVVAFVMEKGLFDDICVLHPQEWKLDLRRLSSGAALVALYQWLGHLLTVARHLEDMKRLNLGDHLNAPPTINLEDKEVHTSGVPVHVDLLLPLMPVLSEALDPMAFQGNSKSEPGGVFPPLLTVVTGWGKLSKQEGSSIVKTSVQKEIFKLRAPFRPSADSGRWMVKGELLMSWLMNPQTAARLVISDLAAEASN